jgi:hypothetical protein
MSVVIIILLDSEKKLYLGSSALQNAALVAPLILHIITVDQSWVLFQYTA